MDARAPVDESDGATAAIAIDELSKVYHLDATRVARLRRLLRLGGHPMEVRALDRLSLSVRPGEALGVIGENGAGKSTLMKIVAGTTQPSSGQMQVNGLVASILELGAGFHPEFSGRDNAMLYGALMGIGRDEMRRRLERILEFAELGEFIVHPIKSYSTGMTMRLAFAVATHVSPAILVIDEALAVGDGYFQKKCIDRLIEVKARGTTILFCSHAMYFVTQFCDRVAWLERGRLRRLGPTQEVVDAYEASLLLREKRRLGDDDAATAPGLGSAGTVGAKVGRIAALRLLDEFGREVSDGLKPGQPFTVEVQAESARPEEPYHVGVAIDTVDGRCVLGLSTSWDGEPPLSGRSSYRMRLEIPGVPMAHGTFHVSAFLLDDTGLHVHDQVMLPEALKVSTSRWTPSLLEVEHSWRLVGEPE